MFIKFITDLMKIVNSKIILTLEFWLTFFDFKVIITADNGLSLMNANYYKTLPITRRNLTKLHTKNIA